MTDIIWGNGSEIISKDSFILKVTHQKNGNKNNYSNLEKIKIMSADIPGLPQDDSNWSPEKLKECIFDAFLKCEVSERTNEGQILARVSHSGVGGY